MTKGECLCPFCKTVANSTVPIHDEYYLTPIEENVLIDYTPSEFRELFNDDRSTGVSSSTLSDYLGKFLSVFSASNYSKLSIDSNFNDKIYRFLDNIHQAATTIVSFPGNINQVTSVSSKLKYEDLMKKFLKGDFKTLHSVSMLLQSFAYTFSVASYQNLTSFFLTSSSTHTEATNSGSWDFTTSEKKLFNEYFHLLEKIPYLFRNEGTDDQTYKDSFYYVFYEFSYFQMCFGNSFVNKKSFGLNNLPAGASLTANERFLSTFKLFPSFLMIANQQSSFPDFASLLEIFSYLSNYMEHYFSSEDGQSEEEEQEKLLFFSQFYSFFHSTPLLSQDLMNIMMGMIPILFRVSLNNRREQKTLLKEFFKMFILMKMNQILMEPTVSGIYQTSDDSFTKDKQSSSEVVEDTILHDHELRNFYNSLSSIQMQIYAKLHLPVPCSSTKTSLPNTGMIGNQLLEYFLQSMIPFLEVMIRLAQLLQLYESDDNENEGGEDENDEMETDLEPLGIIMDMTKRHSLLSLSSTMKLEEKNQQLLSYYNYLQCSLLSLPSLQVLLSAVHYQEMIELWNEGFYDFYHHVGKDSEISSRINER
jgi:hypothetical protein